MFCRNCGGNLLPSDKFCVKCGTPVELSEAEKQSMQEQTAESQTWSAGQDVQPAQAPTWNAGQQPQQTWGDPSYGQQTAGGQQFSGQSGWSDPSMQQAYAASYFDQPVKKERKPLSRRAKGWIIGGSCALAACLAIAITVIFAGAQIKNLWRSTFSSPESYYQAVESESLDVTREALTGIYGAYTNPLSGKGKGSSAKIRFELSDMGKSMLSTLLTTAGQGSISGFDSFEIDSAAGTIEGDKIAIDFDVKLNDIDLLKAKLSSNLSTGETYLQVPSRSPVYLDLTKALKSADSSTIDKIGLTDIVNFVRNGMPSDEELESVIKKYSDIILKSIHNVEKSSETITSGGVSQDVTALEAKISGQDLNTLLNTCLDELEKDEIVKKFYDTITAKSGGTAPRYDELIRQGRSEVERIQMLITGSDGYLMCKDYVDSRGDIIGRTIKLVAGLEEFGFEYKMPVDGGQFAMELNLFGYGKTETIVSGEGTVNGGRLNGIIKVNSGGITSSFGADTSGNSNYSGSTTNFRISDFDINAMRKGELDGTINFDLPSGSIMGAMTIALEMKAKGSSASIKTKLMISGTELGSFTMAFEDGDCPSPLQPGAGDKIYEATDPNDMAGFTSEMAFPDLLKRIQEITGINLSGMVTGTLPMAV